MQTASATSRPDWSRIRRVLLVRLRSIGDTVLMTPCLEALKAWRPELEITVLLEPLSASILEAHPLVDHLIVAEKSLAARARLIGRLRRARFDMAFNLHGGTTATLLARLAGARQTAGYKGYRASWMLGLRAPDPDVILGRAQLHSVEQQLALLCWTGVPWPVTRPQLRLAVSSAAEKSVRAKLQAALVAATGNPRGIDEGMLHNGFALIAPAAAFESKRWEAAGFASIIEHLRERWQLPSVVIAGPGQESLAREVATATRAGALWLTGLSLQELMALINLARVFVGNDSGPMHIAAAFGRPLVAVFGSSNASVWHPWTDSPYRIVAADTATRRRGDIAKDEAFGADDSGFAIRQVPPGKVVAAVDQVLELALAAS